jgi:tight adherence protein B
MSSESKASASIIGSLPFLVGVMVYVTSPKYMELLWMTEAGRLVMGASAIWMGIGIFVMKNMINFDI